MTAAPPAPGPDALVLVDKPGGMTSHDVVARVRRLAGTRKVGHAGTLDPMATGLLVLGINRATRLLTYLVGADKTYLATIRLGQATVTDDAEGDVTRAPGAAQASPQQVRDAVVALRGPIAQVPSAVSAIKVDGRRSYARVRAGEQVDLAAREVTVHAFDVGASRRALAADGTPVLDVDVEVSCSSGTYVRALARDLGDALGTAGHLTALRRTRVGVLGLADAATLDEHGASLRLLDPGTLAARIFPTRELDDDEAVEIGFGRRLAASGREEVTAALHGGRLVALLRDRDGDARPVLVLTPA